MRVEINIIFITEHRFAIDIEFLMTYPSDSGPFFGFTESQVRMSDNANLSFNIAHWQV